MTSFGWHEDQQQRPRPAAHCTRPHADCKDIQHFVGLSSRYHRQPWWGLCNDNAYDSMPWRWWYGTFTTSCFFYELLRGHAFHSQADLLKIISVCHLFKSPPTKSYPHALHYTPNVYLSTNPWRRSTNQIFEKRMLCFEKIIGFPMLCIRWLTRQMRFARNVRSNANCKRSIATYPWPFIWSKFLSFCR